MKYADIIAAYHLRAAITEFDALEDHDQELLDADGMQGLPQATRADIASYARTRINELLQALGVEVEDGSAEREDKRS